MNFVNQVQTSSNLIIQQGPVVQYYEKQLEWMRQNSEVITIWFVKNVILFDHFQVFEVREALVESSTAKMNKIIGRAVNLCACVYIFVGSFGYIALYHADLGGNWIIYSGYDNLICLVCHLAID